MKRLTFILVVFLFPALMTCEAQSGCPDKALQATQKQTREEINILWTTENRDVFIESIVPYVSRCFDQETEQDLVLIVWGSALEVLAEDENLQNKLASLIDEGLKVKTSRFLADQYEITERLTDLGIIIGTTDEILTKPLTEENKGIISL